MNRINFWPIFRIKTILAIQFATFVCIPAQVKAAPETVVVSGQSGGTINSKSCGFVSTKPSYSLSLSKRTDYLQMSVTAEGGQPTLLVIGPKKDDSYCILGDINAGLKPEISGVWEAGKYEVYVGDRYGERHQFKLDISAIKK